MNEQIDIEVEVSWDKLDLDDLLLLEDFQAKRNVNPIQMTGFLDRVIVGGIRGKHYPKAAMGDLFNAVADAINRETNPLDPSGKVSSSA
jgi:ribosome biogenesis SPOUT family RNA methylase Rps3